MIDKSSSYKYTVAAEQNVQERAYWSKQLDGELLKSAFPQDVPKDVSKDSHSPRRMEVETVTLSPMAVDQLMKLSKGNDVKLHMILTAGLFVLLYKYSGNEDMTIGSPILKQEVQLDFINTILVFRNQIKEQASFKQFLLEVRDVIIGANKNQNYPIEVLIKQLDLPVVEDEFPLFDVTICLENLYDKNFIQSIPYNIGFSFLRTGEFIHGEVVYNASLYSVSFIHQIFHHFSHLLEVLLQHMEVELSTLDILTPEQRQQVLFAYNQTQAPYPEEKTVHGLFADVVARVPDQIAILGESLLLLPSLNPMSMTHGQLNQQSQQLAKQLKARGCGPGTIVAIIIEPSIEMMVGLLGILYAGGAYLPIEPNTPSTRIDFILKDSGATILLTTQNIIENIIESIKENIIENTPIVFDKEILLFDSIQSDEYPTTPSFSLDSLPVATPLHPAYIIYTSGTTGKPKGIVTEHRHVVAYIHSFWAEFEVSATDIAVQLTTYTFDLFIEEIFPVLLRGGKIVVPTKADVLDFDLLCQFIFTQQVTIIDCTPLLLNEFNNRCVPGTTTNPLASVHTFISGGDVLKAEYVPHLLQIGNVYNTYGPTETTVCATYYRYSTPHNVSLLSANIPIGKPIMNYQVVILDKHNNPVPVGVGGELCIGGVGVARGYLNRPELTHDKFIFFPSLSATLYKTGDLARWLADGNIEFLGRLDFQVKIRGFRIELGDIEAQLLKYHLIHEAYVMVREEQNGEKYICAYLVPRSTDATDTPNLSDLRAFLESRLPDYMIPAYFVWLDKMPLSPTGKLDRKALPVPQFKSSDTYVAPRNEIETKIVAIWSELLARDPGHAEQLLGTIGIDDNFFELGGHSLRATTMMSKIHKELNVKIELVDIFKTPTIRDITRFIQGSKIDLFKMIEPTEEKEYYPLSSAQKRLYFLQQLEPNGTGYNIPLVLSLGQRLDNPIEKEKQESTLKQLIARHESLRTSFQRVNEEIVQIIHPAQGIEFSLDYCEAHTTPLAEIINGYIKPFNLGQAPLIRSALIKLPDGNFIWLVDIHHIVSDGESHTILVEDFLQLDNAGGPLKPLPIQYKDFAQWQNRLFKSEAISPQKEYWLKLYAGEIPRLHFPTDYKRPEVFTFQGAHHVFALEGEEAIQFKALGARMGGTLYMNLLALVNTLLYKYTGQTDIIIGSGIAGRQHADLDGVVGVFVNTLAMRNYPHGEKSYQDFLKEVIATSVTGFENQDIQFEDLVEKLHLERDLSRNPLFDVAIVGQNFRQVVQPLQQQSQHEGSNETLPTNLYNNATAKFDLTFFFAESRDDVNLGIEYYTPIFKEQTIFRLVSHLKNLIQIVITHPTISLKDIDILSQSEKTQILYDFNNTAVHYPATKTIPQLFMEQVERTPDHVAIIGTTSHSGHITYAELNNQSDHLAHWLQANGIFPDTIVAIMAERSLEMMIGIFAIIKSGAAYLPIDPGYPQERIDYIFKDSGAKILLTQQFIQAPTIINPINPRSPINPTNPITPTNLAYVIYTSGSTGNPKGVLIEHHALVNRLLWMQRAYPLDHGDTILQKTTVTFDVSVWELFWWSIVGAKLCLLPPGGEKDPAMITQTIQQHRVTVMHFVPSMLNVFLDYLDISNFANRLSSLKQVFASGEELTPQQVAHFNRLLYSSYCTKLTNLYGPTEATIDVSYFDCSPFEPPPSGPIPIGKPISNICLFIIDKNFHIQPLGVAGELCIGGVGLARGYINRPLLTHEKFISLPHLTHLTNASTIVYKTGDLARWLPDGNIEFLGRLDFQVKIRGFRIELGEIEAWLVQHEAVKEAVVLCNDDETRPGGEKILCAYIVSAKTMDAGELRNHLTSHLPGHMVPSFFKQVETMPLSPSGKIDRQVLRASGTRIGGGQAFLAPGTDTEQRVARIWSEVLPVSDIKVGVFDNFFDMGGTSMDVIRLGIKIAQEFQREIPIIAFYKYTTIRALADVLAQDQTNPAQQDADAPEKQAERVERVEKGRVDRNKMRDMRKKSDRR